MKAAIKVVSIFFFLFMLISFEQCSEVHSETVTLQDKALAYVKNVLPFDMNHYTPAVSNAYSLPSGPNDPTKWEAVDVNLKSSDSTIHVACLFVNGVLLQCGVSITSGAPISDKPYANLKETVVRILQKHQEQIGVDSTDLINAISLVDETKTINITLGNVTLSVSHLIMPTSFLTVNGLPVPIFTNSTSSTLFKWTYVLNGVLYNYVTLTFDNKTLHDLQDDRAAHPIGGIEVDITKEQAISKADQYLSNYTNKFNLIISNASAKLIGYLRNYTALYPAWWVLVDFNQTNVQEVDVKVWADSGEVFDCYQEGSPLNISQLATITTPVPTPMPQPTTTTEPSNDTPSSVSASTSTANQVTNGSPSATQEPTNPQGKQQLAMSISIAAVAAYVIVLITVATYKRKKPNEKQNNPKPNF